PSKRTRPDFGCSKPMMLLRSVVLPTPLRPMRQTTSPGGTCMSTWRRICVSPYDTDSCSISSIRFPILSQVDFNYFGIALHFADGPLAEDFPFVQHRDFHGNLPHECHVMIDDEQRVFTGHGHEQLAGAF